MAERALSHNIVTLTDVMRLGGDYETYTLSDLRFRTPGPYKLEHLAVHLRGEDRAPPTSEVELAAYRLSECFRLSTWVGAFVAEVFAVAVGSLHA